MYPIPPTETLRETKTCRHCSASFPITDKDLEFYEKISPTFNGKKYSIPSPTLCPDCRQQRRLSFRNERKLYKRKCDATGQDIISIYSPDKPLKVYNQDFWWSDKWDPMEYGRDFDFGRGFFEQFEELLRDVPLPSRAAEETTMINSDYCNEAGYNKDCYLCFEISQSEKCLYSSECVQCTECIDCLSTENCRRCYMSFASINCDSCIYLMSSDNCSESQFCANCISCHHCFLCTNLRNQEYCFQNKKYEREEWTKLVETFLSEHTITDIEKIFREFCAKGFEKLNHNIMTERCVGDYLTNSKNCYSCFSCGDSEDCRYCDHLIAGAPNTDSMDISYFGIGIEQCYE